MFKKFSFLFALIAIVFSSFAQSESKVFKIIVTDTPKLWKFDKGYNRQVLTWKLDKIPFIIDSYPLAYPLIKSHDIFTDVSQKIPKSKIISFYCYGRSIDFQAFDIFEPRKSSLVSKGEKAFNYFKENGVYFKIFNSKGIDVSDRSFTNIITSSSLLKRIYEEESRILATTLKPNDFLLVNFYDKKTDTLLRTYYLKRIQTTPQAKKVWIISSSFSESQQVLNLPKNNQFNLHANQKLVLEFGTNKFQKDSTIQYQLLDSKLSDTSWHQVDRFLTIGNLKSKADYTLKLRYDFQKESIIIYQIHTQAYWHQTVTFFIFIGVLGIILIVLITIGFIKNKVKIAERKQQQLQQEIRSIQNQLNPHFTFNALGSIQGLINTNKVEEASHYLTEFSSLLRTTLTNSHLIYVSLHKEILLLETYLKLEQLRFGFYYELTVNESIHQNEVDIPNFLLQPIIENAVKHGISSLGKNGRVQIHFDKVQSDLLITITDNGKGFDEHTIKDGLGIRFVKEKINLLNTLLRYEAIRLSYMHSNGTIVYISFHNWLS